MEKIKKIIFTVFLAALLGTAPLLSFADEPQATPDQQTIVAPADQSADQQAPPAAPAPQEEGSSTKNSN